MGKKNSANSSPDNPTLLERQWNIYSNLHPQKYEAAILFLVACLLEIMDIYFRKWETNMQEWVDECALDTAQEHITDLSFVSISSIFKLVSSLQHPFGP